MIHLSSASTYDKGDAKNGEEYKHSDNRAATFGKKTQDAEEHMEHIHPPWRARRPLRDQDWHEENL